MFVLTRNNLIILFLIAVLVTSLVGYAIAYTSLTPDIDRLNKELDVLNSKNKAMEGTIAGYEAEIDGLKSLLDESVGDEVIVTFGLFNRMPKTVDSALAEGYVSLSEPGMDVVCVPNMGKHYAKIVDGVPTDPILLFDNEGNLIGLEFESLSPMNSPPWEHLEAGHPGMEFEHWTLHIFFSDPSTAC